MKNGEGIELRCNMMSPIKKNSRCLAAKIGGSTVELWSVPAGIFSWNFGSTLPLAKVNRCFLGFKIFLD